MRRTLTALVSAALALGPAPLAVPALPVAAPPDAVEEDWVLVVGTPSPAEQGPQITTAMSPVADPAAPFVGFDLNYREFPDFAPGGMQVQVWSGEDCLQASTQGTAQFDSPGETISWTQRMSLANGAIQYDVINGQSTTWGQFGQAGTPLSVTYPSAVASLAGYDPAASVARSGASWQSNRVISLTLATVRYYAGGRLIATDSAPRPVPLDP